MQSLRDTYRLRNGVEIPCVGFGTWQTPDGDVAVESVRAALSLGYRHVDTAAIYRNEAGVGGGVRESGVPREEVFVTSKLWNTERGYESTLAAFDRTMEELGLEYLDLYLIHWPASPAQFEDWEQINLDTWRAMTELYRAGRVRAIGVSNFHPHHLKALVETEVPPQVNQIEFHPGFMQSDVVAFCKEHDILVQAWSPLGTGEVLADRTLQDIAGKYGKSTAQLCIRWCLQHGVLPLPKSVTPARIAENADVFDFEIAPDDMAAIDELPYIGGLAFHPDKMDE